MAVIALEELLARGRRLETRRAAAVAAAAEAGGADQLARKELEEVLRIAEAARLEARKSYILEQGRRLRLRLRPGAG